MTASSPTGHPAQPAHVPAGADAAVVPPFLRTPIARLVRALAPTRIVLFGSYAKGCARPRSDVDLLVIAEAAAGVAPDELARRVRQLVAPNFPPIDVVMCTPEEARDAAKARSPFLRSILDSGITVYARPASREIGP